jgi:hypothetical protein
VLDLCVPFTFGNHSNNSSNTMQQFQKFIT